MPSRTAALIVISTLVCTSAIYAQAPPRREVREGDIVVQGGSHLYVLNSYAGLEILDFSDLDRPRVIGKAPILGWPTEMYVEGTNALIVFSEFGSPGSQLSIVDLSDKSNPRIVGGINLGGDAVDSRIVGDILYLVSSRVPWYNRFTTVDVREPSHVVTVEEFRTDGRRDHHLAATSRTIYLSSSREGAHETEVRYVDISGPTGQIRVRGAVTVPGQVRDRWSMDVHEGVLRVASGTSGENPRKASAVLGLFDADEPSRLGGATLQTIGDLTATLLHGPDAYLGTGRHADPLFHFDISAPALPRLVGTLEMTGWLDFMVPMGDRIVALGHEDAVDERLGSPLAISLIDVAGPQPRLLSRVTLGEGWGWVPGDRDDFGKVFSVQPSGLIAAPFRAWSGSEHRYVGGVQLIEIERDTLVRRAFISEEGCVQRAVIHDPQTLLIVSDEALQIVDISDRDRPWQRSRVELAQATRPCPVLHPRK